MKFNRLIVSAMTILVLGLAACNNNSPKAVAEKFLVSFYHWDYEKAKEVSTDETKELVSLIEQLSVQQPDSVKQNIKKIQVEVLDVKEEGDNAIVTYTVSSEPGEQKLKLVKQNGKWLVSHSKQDDLEDDTIDEVVPDDTTE